MTRDEEVIWLARKLKYVREAGPNSGLRVNAIQRWCGGKDNESWCAYFATMILDIVYQGKSPIPRTGSCDTILRLAKKNDWLTIKPSPGDLYLLLNSEDDAHHCGIVVRPAGATAIREISGNTNVDGSSNGIGVFERERTWAPGKIIFCHYPRS